MKNLIFTVAAIAFVAVTASTSFGQNIDRKSEKARENLLESRKDVTEAKRDLKIAQTDSAAEYLKFKKESEVKIANNEKSIAVLKGEVAKANLKEKADYEKKLAVLEQKNASMKKELEEYKVGVQTRWSTFKFKFGNDLDKLGGELKDFFDRKK